MASRKLKSVALPPEHGGWGMLVEPMVLGLAVVPSFGGFLVCAALLAVFLVRHPLKMALIGLRTGRVTATTRLGARIAIAYALAAAMLLAATLWVADGPFWMPLVVAAPLGLVHFHADAFTRGRAVGPETLGVMALASSAAAVALARTEAWPLAGSLWALGAVRNVSTIYYVRARLRVIKGKPLVPAPAAIAHAIAIVVAILLALRGWGPWTGIAAVAVLVVRAVWFLRPSASRKTTKPKHIGIQELVVGALYVLLLVLGFLAERPIHMP